MTSRDLPKILPTITAPMATIIWVKTLYPTIVNVVDRGTEDWLITLKTKAGIKMK